MAAPIFSTITLIAELLVASIIFYIIYMGYTKGRIPFLLTFFALGYEIVFNVGYMIIRSLGLKEASHLPKSFIGLAIFHGVLSLAIFIAAIIFLGFAVLNYRKNVNFFKKYRKTTISIIALWTIALISGIIVYFLAYY